MGFDLDAYQRSVEPVVVDDLDMDLFRTVPLRPEHLRCLCYAHDVEMHTSCYLRNLLNTRAHGDPEITAFLTLWSFEEYWHGEALARVMGAHGEPAGPARVAALRKRQGWRANAAPLGWWAFSAANPHFLAVHMTFGVINEWSTQAGYARLAAQADHPVLGPLLQRIMRQEGRHIDYYLAQARGRLAHSIGAQRTTRAMLRAIWSPVGHKVLPRAESRHQVRTLFGDGEGRSAAARIDRRIDALPGLAGLRLLSQAVDRYGS
ncbi:MAG: ferritin-like domain-containing protein [Acidimicrobiales bacterium]